jgi:hypothetical protein
VLDFRGAVTIVDCVNVIGGGYHAEIEVGADVGEIAGGERLDIIRGAQHWNSGVHDRWVFHQPWLIVYTIYEERRSSVHLHERGPWLSFDCVIIFQLLELLNEEIDCIIMGSTTDRPVLFWIGICKALKSFGVLKSIT